MGQKALQKSFATSHGKNSFAKNQFDGKNDLAKVFCKAFCPMGKKALQKINLTEKIDVAKEISFK